MCKYTKSRQIEKSNFLFLMRFAYVELEIVALTLDWVGLLILNSVRSWPEGMY